MSDACLHCPFSGKPSCPMRTATANGVTFCESLGQAKAASANQNQSPHEWTPSFRPSVPVAFIGPTAQPVGGTERWHRTLLPMLGSERVNVIGYGVESLSDPDPSSYGVPVVSGRDAMRSLVARSRVVVAWGLHDPGVYLPRGWAGAWVSTSHGDDRSSWSREWLASAERHTTRYAAVHDAARRAIPEHRRGDAAVIHPGVAIPAQVALWSDRTIVYAGRLSPEKRVDRIIAALARLPEWRLVVVGSGASQGPWRAEAARLGVADRVEWRGSHPAWWEVASGVFCHLSETEGFGLAPMEALAAGMPLVMASVGFAAGDDPIPGLWRVDPDDAARVAAMIETARPVPVSPGWVNTHYGVARQSEEWTRFILDCVTPVPLATPPAPNPHMERLARVRACPHREPQATKCGCQGQPATCRAGRGDLDSGRTATLSRCIRCVSGEP